MKPPELVMRGNFSTMTESGSWNISLRFLVSRSIVTDTWWIP